MDLTILTSKFDKNSQSKFRKLDKEIKNHIRKLRIENPLYRLIVSWRQKAKSTKLMNPKNDRVSLGIPSFKFALERLFRSSVKY